MAYVYTAITIVVIGFIFYKIVKKKAPANQYIPFDAMMTGIKQDIRQDDPLQDTKHQIDFQEETKSSDKI